MDLIKRRTDKNQMQYRFTDLIVDESVRVSCYPERFTSLIGKELEPGILVQKAIDQGPVRGMQLLSLNENHGTRTTVKMISNRSTCIMSFILSGELNAAYIDGEMHPYNLASGQHNLLYSTGFEILFDILQPASVLLIHLDEQFIEQLIDADFPELKDFAEKIRQRKTTPASVNMPVTPAMSTIISILKQSSTSGCMKQLLFQSKIMELLNLQIEQFAVAKGQEFATSLKSYDVDKILYARQLVEENIRTPCSLIELAHKAGLNDFKLKKGFKEIVGNTVFGYLFELRMEHAHELLLKRKSVSEVAWQTGYKNPHHFTAAFKKKFGFLPSQLNR